MGRGAIPAEMSISDGKMGDVKVLDILPVEAGAFYVMDRGYLDFGRLFKLHQAGAFFVTRAKRGMNARRVYSTKTDRSTGVVCDQAIRLNGFYVSKDYPEHVRRIRFKDPESGKTLVFLTNNTTLPPSTIAALYKSRWQVELFFKWISNTCASSVFGHQRERGEDANRVRRVHLRADCHRQKGASLQCLALHFVTDFVGLNFRENPYFMRLAARYHQNHYSTNQ